MILRNLYLFPTPFGDMHFFLSIFDQFPYIIWISAVPTKFFFCSNLTTSPRDKDFLKKRYGYVQTYPHLFSTYPHLQNVYMVKRDVPRYVQNSSNI